MKFQLKNTPFVAAPVDAVILPLMKGSKKYPSFFSDMDEATDGLLMRRLQDSGFEGNPGEVLFINTGDQAGPKAVMIVGMGEQDKFNTSVPRISYAAAARRAVSEGVKELAILYLENDLLDSLFSCSVEGLLLGAYVFDKYKSEKAKPGIAKVSVHYLDNALTAKIKRHLKKAEVFSVATNFARDLVNLPAIDLYPESLAKICRQEFKGAGFTLKIFSEQEIKRRKMTAFLSVANGTPHRPKFIHVNYKPKGKCNRRVALVGKGVTFDTGGLSLKPAKYMIDMKSDMAGAATVLAVMRALPKLNIDVEVDAIVAATENVPGMDSTRPGDVVYAMNGKSIEVLNTDAEGRLTLADALCYACKLPRLTEVIDLATLTGACVVALGDQIAGAMTNNDEFLQRLSSCGKAAAENLWQLPLAEEYKNYIKGDIADIKNMGPDGGLAGTITAGLFLQHFVTCDSWVHIDIAGPAFVSRDMTLSPKGGSGFAVRTLLTYLTTS